MSLGRRPPAGSLSDLRSRLARLPDGHPSSPYDDGGTQRPPPIRLKQLELGLPAPERVHPGPIAESGRVSEPGTGPHLDSGPQPADFDRPAEPSTTASPPPATDVAPPAPDPNANGHSGAPRRARPQWQDPYASPPGNGHSWHSRPGAPADLALGPWSPGTETTAGTNGDPRTSDAHTRPNPQGPRDTAARPGVPDRAEIPPQRDAAALADPLARHGPVARPDIGQPNHEIRDLTAHVMALSRTAEGRNQFGDYGSSGVTPAIQRIAAQLPYGGLAPGSEANSVKSPERFAAKLARLIARNPGRPAEDLAWAIYDVIRYAFSFEPADYIEGTWLVHRKLKTQGFELEARRNRWENPEYKGIWTRWRDPAHSLAFEVQFHTPASWVVVQRTHEAYMRITDPATPPGERARLRAGQVSAAAEASPPPRCLEIGDFRADAR